MLAEEAPHYCSALRFRKALIRDVNVIWSHVVLQSVLVVHRLIVAYLCRSTSTKEDGLWSSPVGLHPADGADVGALLTHPSTSATLPLSPLE